MTKWRVTSRSRPTSYTDNDRDARLVNPANCELINPGQPLSFDEEVKKEIPEYEWSLYDAFRSNNQPIFEEERQGGNYGMWEIVLFNLEIMTSFLAGYTPLVFYSAVVYVNSTLLSTAVRTWTYQAWVIEIARPVAIHRLIEAIHLHKQEENLVAEEETFYLLVEIVRSPELVRAITASRVRGSASPEFDGLSESEKKKLRHLDELEAKGFDVELLKEEILKNSNMPKEEKNL
jgi:hypothetical protein